MTCAQGSGTGWRWRIVSDRVAVLELQVTGTEWRRHATMGLPTMAAVCAAGARLVADQAGERAPHRGGGSVLEG